uniref:Cadherin domain-containing protein n=1 Tax=Romanomermis culicivorax TaxID=13658 RepID=A0A915HL93_ROMCU
MDVNVAVFAADPLNTSKSRIFLQDSFTFTVEGSTDFVGNLGIRNDSGLALTIKLMPERYSTFFTIDQNGIIRYTSKFKLCESRIKADEICFIASVMDANNRILDQVPVTISFSCTKQITRWLAILPKDTKPGDQVYIAQLQNLKDLLKSNESLHLPSNPCFTWDPERRILVSTCQTADNFTASGDMLNFTVTSDDPETPYQKTEETSYEIIPKIEESIDNTVNTVQYMSTTITSPPTVNDTQDLICRSAYFEKSMQNVTINDTEVNITTAAVNFESQDAERLCPVTYTISYAEELNLLPKIFAIDQRGGRIYLIKSMDNLFFDTLYKLTNQNRSFTLVVDASLNNDTVKLRSKITINVNFSTVLNLNRNFTFEKSFYDFRVDSANMLPNGSIIGIVKVKSDCEKVLYAYRLSSASELPLKIDESSGALYFIRSSSFRPMSDNFQIQIITKQTGDVVASVPAKITFQENRLAPKFDIASSVTKNFNNISELLLANSTNPQQLLCVYGSKSFMKTTLTTVIKITPQYATSQLIDLFYKLNNMQDLFYMQVRENEAELQMISPSQTPAGAYNLNISVTSPDLPAWTEIFSVTVNITEEMVASGSELIPLPLSSKIFYQEIETATLSSTSKPIMQLNLTSSNYTHVIRISSLNLHSPNRIDGKTGNGDRYTDNHKDLFDFNETSGEIKLKRYPRSEELGKGYMIALGLVNDTKTLPSTETLVHIYFPNISNITSIADQNATQLHTNRVFPKVFYYVEIPENISIGTNILELNSTLDASDRKAFYKIKSGSGGKFNIGLNTGVITVTNEVDAENQTEYLLVVKSGAQNFDVDPHEIQTIMYSHSSNPSQNVQFVGNDETIVFINVTDVNDNAPMIKFAIRNYDRLLFPVQNISRTVGFVPAYDWDSTSKLQYNLLKANDSENFTIDQNKGLISIRKDRSIGEKSVYNFEIVVVVLNDTTQAVVHLIDDMALMNLSHFVHEFDLNSSRVIVDFIEITNQSVDNNGSYLLLYGYNTTSSNLLEGQQLVDFISKKWTPSLKLNFPSIQLDNVTIFREFEAHVQKPGRDWFLSVTEIALLIAVACLLIVLLVCGAILACLLWKKVINCGGGRMKEDDNYMLDSQFSTTKPYEKHLPIAK